METPFGLIASSIISPDREAPTTGLPDPSRPFGRRADRGRRTLPEPHVSSPAPERRGVEQAPAVEDRGRRLGWREPFPVEPTELGARGHDDAEAGPATAFLRAAGVLAPSVQRLAGGIESG